MSARDLDDDNAMLRAALDECLERCTLVPMTPNMAARLRKLLVETEPRFEGYFHPDDFPKNDLNR